MIHVQPFKPEHLKLIELRHGQELDDEDAQSVNEAARHESWSIWVRDSLMLCGGIMCVDPEQPLVWSIFSGKSGQHMLPLYRVTERILSTSPHKLLYSTTGECFEQGRRFLELLRFEYLDRIPFLIDGATQVVYVRQN